MHNSALNYLCVILLATQAFSNEYPHMRSVFGAIFDSRPPAATMLSETTSCAGCAQKYSEVDQNSKQERYTVTEEEITALRIEYIKNQILRKLRLKQKPTVSISHLPIPVTEDDSLVPKGHDDSTPSPFDDYYGRTTQAIVFPYEDEARCVRKVHYPTACLPFKLPSDIHASDLSTAELWFHKEPDIEDSHNQTFTITEVAHWDTKKVFKKTTPLAIVQTNVTDGWLKVDVAQVIRNWLDYQDSPIHAINVVCKTCGKDANSSPVSFKPSLKPFLVIYTHTQRRSLRYRRTKRHSTTKCSSDSKECCRESLYISFAEIGWGDWIIQPPGYNAYFCKGSCPTVASLTISGSQHNYILHRLSGNNQSIARKLELTPCCAATRYSPLQLFYMDNNKTITSKILSNMIVDDCGCM